MHWAEEHNIPVHHFPAKWEEYGISAGFIRNAEMGDFADAAIIFWDGESKGTAQGNRTADTGDWRAGWLRGPTEFFKDLQEI